MKLLVLAALAAFGLNAADLAGTWKGTMETQMGATAVAITLQPGEAVAGKVLLGEYEAAIEKAASNGDKLTFEVNVGPGKVAFAGVVAGEQIKFEVIGTQGDKYALVCQRQK